MFVEYGPKIELLLHRLRFCFRTTLIAVAGFLDAFQKVADMATGSRGKKIALIDPLTLLEGHDSALYYYMSKHPLSHLSPKMYDHRVMVLELVKTQCSTLRQIYIYCLDSALSFPLSRTHRMAFFKSVFCYFLKTVNAEYM